MKGTIGATLQGIGGHMVSGEATHSIALTANRQRMWELFWAIAAELQRDHTFHSRDPRTMDLSVDLYVEVTSGLD